MDTFPLVYAVLLNFNSAKDTVNCIESIKRITYPNIKIVVVDNNSSDNSVELLKALSGQFKLILSCDNFGYAKGNNIGIKYALEQGAEYICILNSDVEVEENFLEPIIEFLSKNKNTGIAGPCICDFENKAVVQSLGAYINLYTGLAMGKNKGSFYKSIKEAVIDVDYLGGACFVCKREVFEKVGLIPENYFLFYEESEFCLKAKGQGYSLKCITESRVYHKGSATISKYSGLSYYFLNRNRIIFMRRNADLLHKIIFALYLPVETLGRVIIRKESFKLFCYYYEGLKADKHNIDFEKVKAFMK